MFLTLSHGFIVAHATTNRTRARTSTNTRTCSSLFVFHEQTRASTRGPRDLVSQSANVYLDTLQISNFKPIRGPTLNPTQFSTPVHIKSVATHTTLPSCRKNESIATSTRSSHTSCSLISNAPRHVVTMNFAASSDTLSPGHARCTVRFHSESLANETCHPDTA